MNSHLVVEKVRGFCETYHLLEPSQTIILGLSGGPDSVALLSILHTLQPSYNYRLIVASLDHQWRPESRQEIHYCRELAASFSLEFVTAKADEIMVPRRDHLTQEELGRALRRGFFEKLVKEYDGQAIAVGHHYNDQQETFFLRMIRGASVAGLAAMKAKNRLYIRPLLSCTKEELLTYLADQSLSYCIDATNDDESFLRNAIRHRIIPAFRECDSRFEESFRKTLHMMQETDNYLDRVAQDTLRDVTIECEGSTLLSIKPFLATDRFLHERLIILWLCKAGVPFTPSNGFFNELLRFMHSQGTEHQIQNSWKIKRSKGMLSIEKSGL